MRHLFNAHAIAAASPSIGAYLVSASLQNLDPAKTSFHPSGQQTGALSIEQEQYFCNKRKPIPCLLQSGARQVTLSRSNVDTPSLTKSVIILLDSTNAFCRDPFQVNSDLALIKSLKGCMIGPRE